MYKVKVGTESIYTVIIDTTMKKVLLRAQEECKRVPNIQIIEMKDSKNNLIDYELQCRKLEKVKKEKLNGFMNKDSKEKCYRSLQQSMWYKYDKERYKEIKTELKKIKNESVSLDNLKDKYAEYINKLDK